jgi:hypothetical protein
MSACAAACFCAFRVLTVGPGCGVAAPTRALTGHASARSQSALTLSGAFNSLGTRHRSVPGATLRGGLFDAEAGAANAATMRSESSAEYRLGERVEFAGPRSFCSAEIETRTFSRRWQNSSATGETPNESRREPAGTQTLLSSADQ